MAPGQEEKGLKAAEPTAEQLLAVAMSGEVESGYEGTTSQDFVMPLMTLLQKGSPEVNPAKEQYNKDARAGMFLDATTKELLTELLIIPCLYKAQMVEWKPNLGGFVASHDPGIEQGLPRNEKGQFIMPSGNYLADTRYFYCLRIAKDGNLVPIILSLTSTQIKKAKDWMTNMMAKTTKNKANQTVPLPIYLNVCKITSVPEAKAQFDWFGYKIDLVRQVTAEDADLLKKAMVARQTFQVSATHMKPPVAAEVDPENLKSAGANENKHL